MKIKYHFCWYNHFWQLWKKGDNGLFVCNLDDEGYNQQIYNIQTLDELHKEAITYNWLYKDYETYEDFLKEHFSKLL